MYHKLNSVGLSVLVAILLIGCATPSENEKSYNPPNDLVPDAVTAIKIAEAVWLPLYGDEIFKSRPFKAVLKNGTWLVTGTLAEGTFGGTPVAEISQKDGKILRVTHEQ
jgi:hypothetical protein